MSANPQVLRYVPLGAVAAVGLGALLLAGPSAPRADAAPPGPRATAGFQTTDKLVLNVALPPSPANTRGELRVELVGPGEEVVARGERAVTVGVEGGGQRFEFPAPKAAAEGLIVRCRFGTETNDVTLKDILLARPHETTLSAGQEFVSGSTAALRCAVRGVKSATETVPLAGASVEVKLQGPAGKPFTLYTGKAGADGVAAAEFRVPALPAGSYKLQVATRSSFGEEKLERDVRIRTTPKVLLVTDKPLYQPGQVIHVRALALQTFDLTPVAGSELLLEVEDGKGNKVFKRVLPTSEHGIAAADFQLATEVNTGDYHVRATLGDQRADKTVTVKPYVLPKFKSALTADKKFYLPKETIQAELQTDYFFGKPVASGKVKVTASTFDVAFKEFTTWEGKTDAAGHAKFEIKLPDYFVGQPLEKGKALVRLEVKVTDTADHSETVSRTFPVSDQPVRVSLIPEGGRLAPGLENRVFAAALYPDGSPARCEVRLWQGRERKGEPFATLKTNEAGLAEFTLTPKAEQFRVEGWGQRNVELLGGRTMAVGEQRHVFDLSAEARDDRGNAAQAAAALGSDPLGENVLLRLDKAVYQGGDALKVDVRTSAGLPTVYLDVVKSGQTMLTKWLDVKDGKAAYRLDLPPGVFGTLEVHAYQPLAGGEIIRDSRVVYVNPPSDLKIDVKADKDTYLPGADGKITFRVTDASGRPAPAALGVLVVDEAVYAMQEMQPGLEKVYFTLQEELLKPQVQAVYKPGEKIDDLVREPLLADARQQVAEVLLTAVRPKPPARWEVDPAFERRQKLDGQIAQVGWALFSYANQNKPVLARDAKTKAWRFAPGLLDKIVATGLLPKETLTDPVGGRLSLEGIARVEKNFAADRIGRALTAQRLQQLQWAVVNYSNGKQKEWLKDGKWSFPDGVVEDAARSQRLPDLWTKDAWGNPIRLVTLEKKRTSPNGWTQYERHDLVSAGSDGKFGTADDVTLTALQGMAWGWGWWADEADARTGLQRQQMMPRRFAGRGMNMNGALFGKDGAMMAEGAGLGGAPGRGGFPLPQGAPMAPMAAAMEVQKRAAASDKPGDAAAAGGGAPTRLREFFPETLLWRPALVTDDRGVAELPVTFADSITTWRLTASASSRGGALGGVSAPLRVFQDFFVDLDLPVSLTQNDEVAFPVAVYNYLKEPQTVRLDLQAEPWFELVDGRGLTRSLDLKPNEVTSVKFRIRAKRIGHFPLTVQARGSKMSDATKRTVEVVPDGQKVEQVFSDKLAGTVAQTVTIPDGAVPDASKILVKVYPGVFSQVLEGTEGMLRMPGGCFEQTSSAAYPNILVADYIKRNRLASPAVLMKAENYLNVGYQRLLTFERPGGGFDWWGSGEPLVWLSAYGLQEFNDMARVYPVDRGVIERTQRWLLKQQAADGTWSKIGATHSESIERMGDPKLLLTSYVTWALLDSGVKAPELKKSVAYLREHAKEAENAYVLALAANALAAADAQDDSTHEVLTLVLRKLEKLKQDRPEWKAACFPAGGQSLSYARGDSLTVETTALAVLAMLKSGQFANDVNKALAYLVKSKDASGTWGSTQATILSLKALVAASGGVPQKGTAEFVIKVDGKEAASGEVTEANSDVMQLFDLKEHTKPGANVVTIEVKGETNLMYQVVGRHFAPWGQRPVVNPVMEVAVDYDRTKLSTADLLRAKATLRYHGRLPTYQVIVDLGIPPGFTADAGDFAEMVSAKKIQRFDLTSRQAILYLGDVKPGAELTFEYGLKPKFPVKAKTPTTVAYEYYTPAHRGEAKPVELVVEEKK